MNVNPKATTILCFGDSNTHGTRPDEGRYSADIRWTGKLQKLLGNDFYVIEEGLGGRTTNLDHPRGEKPGRSGLTYFKPCLFSHAPVNIVLIMLGTNDFKNAYNRSPKEVASVLAEYCDFVRSFDSNIKILLISPSLIEEVEPVVYYDASSASKSHQLAAEIKKIADEKGTYFYDAAQVVKVGQDGLHWDEASEGRFAQKIEKIVRQFK